MLESVLHVDLVKLDVEGADLHALRGMKGLLDRCKPVLFVECHDIYGYYTRAELEETLTGLGYGFEIANSAMTEWMPDGAAGELTKLPPGQFRQCDWLTCTPLAA